MNAFHELLGLQAGEEEPETGGGVADVSVMSLNGKRSRANVHLRIETGADEGARSSSVSPRARYFSWL